MFTSEILMIGGILYIISLEGNCRTSYDVPYSCFYIMREDDIGWRLNTDGDHIQALPFFRLQQIESQSVVRWNSDLKKLQTYDLGYEREYENGCSRSFSE